MVKSSIRTGHKVRSFFLGLFFVLAFLASAYGRDGIKLYSIGSNPVWNSTDSWSLSINGEPSGLVPQENDTVVIDRTISQNINFSLSGNGLILVTSTGVLQGDKMHIDLHDNSAMQCYGLIKSGMLSFNNNSGFLIEDKGVVTVKKSYQNISALNHYVYGKLLVTGKLVVNQPAKIKGNGIIESGYFEGTGTVFSINNLSVIPDRSVVTEVNWIGSHSSNWQDPANWTGGNLPENASNISVLASSKYPLISGEQYCNNLYINSSALITLQPSAFFNVNGKLSMIGTGNVFLPNKTMTDKASLILKNPVYSRIQSERMSAEGKKFFIASLGKNSLW